ncbi:MAG TPA: biotin/lipoyl-containing protein, partial [Enteractinococcus sp.]
DPDFRSGDFDTSFLSEARLEKVSAPLADEHSVAMSAFAAAVAIESRDIATMPTPPVKPAFRNVGMATSEYRFSVQDETITAQILRDRKGVVSAGGDLTDVRALDFEHRETDSVVRLEHGSVTIPVVVSTYSDGTVATDSVLGPVSMTELPRYEDPSLVATEGSLLSPMPGSIISVDVTNGQTVKAGQVLMSMEAMKMEHAIRATADGVVTDISVAVGDQVDAGKVLAIVSGDEEE